MSLNIQNISSNELKILPNFRAKNSQTKNKYSDKEKLLTGTAALALLGIGLVCVHKMRSGGKLLTGIKKEYDEIFRDTYKLEGKQFVKKASEDIANTIGLTKLPKIEINPTANSKAGISEINIGISQTKPDLYAAIRHELEHAKQHEQIVRAFGKDAFINVKVEGYTCNVINNPIFFENLTGKEYYTKQYDSKLKINILTKRPDEELIKDMKWAIKKYRYKCKFEATFFDDILAKKGKIQPVTSEYKEAEQYLEAQKNYFSPASKQGLYICPDGRKKQWEKYLNNLLEINARKEGEKVKELYNKFLEKLK